MNWRRPARIHQVKCGKSACWAINTSGARITTAGSMPALRPERPLAPSKITWRYWAPCDFRRGSLLIEEALGRFEELSPE